MNNARECRKILAVMFMDERKNLQSSNKSAHLNNRNSTRLKPIKKPVHVKPDQNSLRLKSDESGWLKIDGKNAIKVTMEEGAGHPINRDPKIGGCYFYVESKNYGRTEQLNKYIMSDYPYRLDKHGFSTRKLYIDNIENGVACTFSIKNN
jgi:hypothetical protein